MSRMRRAPVLVLLIGVLASSPSWAADDDDGFLGIGDDRPGVFGIGDDREGAFGIGEKDPE
jgi:hypothetical protein